MEWIDLDAIPRNSWFFVLQEQLRSGHSIGIGRSSVLDLSRYALPQSSVEQTVAIFSGGSTGDPKLVRHSVAKLLSAPRKDHLILGTLYTPDRMAGLQVLAHGMASGNPAYFLDSAAGSLIFRDYGDSINISHLSATPSQLRFFDLSVLRAAPDLLSITLGGEIVTQADISRLKQALPDVHIYQIYASSEFGQMCTVRDELEGLPVSLFDASESRFRISEDGELMFRPLDSVLKGYLPTGDLVARRGDRVKFEGRKDFLVSVGGVLKNPKKIEHALEAWPEIETCSVRVKKSALTGSLLIAEVVLAQESSVKELQQRMRSLPENQQAQMIKIVDSIVLTEAGKAAIIYE